MPGLGHLYSGRIRAAVGLFAADFAVGIAAVLLVAFAPAAPANVIVPIAVYVAFRVWMMTSAWRAARSAVPGPRLLHGGRLFAAGVAFIVVAVAIGAIVQPALRAVVGQAFRIPSASMAPTVLAGDYLFAPPLRDPPEPGTVVVYRREDGMPFLTRVAGVGGDTLAMHKGVLKVNGRTLPEPYAVTDTTKSYGQDDMEWQREHLAGGSSASYSPTLWNWGPLVVPEGHVFVLGDNRSNSLDSRYFGFVGVTQVYARPTRVYLSRDPNTGSIRWARIGRDIGR